MQTIKRTSKERITRPLKNESTNDWWFYFTKSSDAESVSISWRYQGYIQIN